MTRTRSRLPRFRPPPPADKTAATFCKYHLGRDCFAPFTGQDFSGWRAFCYLVELWGRGDYRGRDAAITAMRGIVTGGVQHKECIMQVLVQSIPAILDWSHVAEIWPAIFDGAGSAYAGLSPWARLTAVRLP